MRIGFSDGYGVRVVNSFNGVVRMISLFLNDQVFTSVVLFQEPFIRGNNIYVFRIKFYQI